MDFYKLVEVFATNSPYVLLNAFLVFWIYKLWKKIEILIEDLFKVIKNNTEYSKILELFIDKTNQLNENVIKLLSKINGDKRC